MSDYLWEEDEMVRLYMLVKRPNKEGTMTEAILHHSQACGLVAYLADVHPDAVARAVADDARDAA